MEDSVPAILQYSKRILEEPDRMSYPGLPLVR